MKLVEIAEHQLPHQIITNCKPYLNMIGDSKFQLYRGETHKLEDKSVQLFDTYEERRPRDTIVAYHKIYDDVVFKLTGIRFRSNRIAFVTPNKNEAEEYGKVGYFYPVDNFQYLYFQGIGDFTIHVGPIIGDKIHELANQIVQKAKDKEFIAKLVNNAGSNLKYSEDNTLNGFEMVYHTFDQLTAIKLKGYIISKAIDFTVEQIKPRMRFNTKLLEARAEEIMIYCKQYYLWFK